MGLLTEGHPLSWSEIVAARDILRTYALSELVRIFEKYKDRQGDCFMWGDEVELSLVRFDHSNKRVQLLLKGHQLLPRLVELNETIPDGACRIAWHPEATDYMIEGVPFEPYGFVPSYLNTVEANIALRRKQAQQLLSEQSDCEYVLSLSAFPRLGQDQFTYPVLESHDRCQSFDQSLCYPDAIISPLHPRMRSVLTNISERRQSKPSINIPIYRDSSSPSPFRDVLFEKEESIIDDHIHLDSAVGGLGCCCLQVTFQAQSFNESLHLYDQLLPLTGILLSLSGACPIWRGFLSDIDCRWNVLSQAADDRTVEEQQRPNLPSRYSSTPMYLSDQNKHLNDVKIDVDEEVVSTLMDHGMSPTLSRHFGHLFIRDPLIVIEEQLHPKDDSSSYHFENLNSTVWHSLRFKPPPLNDDQMGWRVEFRPMDIQITDFENASLVVFVAFLTRAIFTYGLDLTIPISQVNENMARAHHRDSVRQESFHFRVGSESRLMSMNEIINGTNDFLGLVPLVQQYFNEREEIDSDTRITVQQYLSLISKRAAGILLTDASWIRQFVTSHPDYKQDSVVSDTVQHDLIWKIIQIVNGHEPCPSLVHSRMQTNTHLHPN